MTSDVFWYPNLIIFSRSMQNSNKKVNAEGLVSRLLDNGLLLVNSSLRMNGILKSIRNISANWKYPIHSSHSKGASNSKTNENLCVRILYNLSFLVIHFLLLNEFSSLFLTSRPRLQFASSWDIQTLNYMGIPNSTRTFQEQRTSRSNISMLRSLES